MDRLADAMQKAILSTDAPAHGADLIGSPTCDNSSAPNFTLLIKHVPSPARARPAGKVYIASKNASFVAGQQAVPIEGNGAAPAFTCQWRGSIGKGLRRGGRARFGGGYGCAGRTSNHLQLTYYIRYSLPAEWVSANSHENIAATLGTKINVTC